MSDTIPTNLGPMTDEQIVDELTYSLYAANRGYGLTAERLALFFGDSKVEAMERRYRLDHALAEEGAAVWPKIAEPCERCAGTGLVTLRGTYMGDADEQPCPECRA